MFRKYRHVKTGSFMYYLRKNESKDNTAKLVLHNTIYTGPQAAAVFKENKKDYRPVKNVQKLETCNKSWKHGKSNRSGLGQVIYYQDNKSAKVRLKADLIHYCPLPYNKCSNA